MEKKMFVFCRRICHGISRRRLYGRPWDVPGTFQHPRYFADPGSHHRVSIISRRNGFHVPCMYAKRITRPRVGIQKRQNSGKIHESYPVIVSSQFGKGMAGCGSMRKTNREPQISDLRFAVGFFFFVQINALHENDVHFIRNSVVFSIERTPRIP